MQRLTPSSRRPSRAAVLTVIVTCACVCATSAQPSLVEVASIRRNVTAETMIKGARFSPGRLQMVNLRLEELAWIGYGFTRRSPRMNQQLVTGWRDATLRDARFDITAILTTQGVLTPTEQSRVVRELLTTRFGLRAHVESRVMDVYTLTTVRPDALGPDLRRVANDCATLAPEDHPRDAQGRSLCRGGNYEPGTGLSVNRGSGEIARLAEALEATAVSAPVIDRTGLTGFFQWEYPPSGALTTRLREHLGLQLTRGRAPVEVVVIDDVQMPSPN